MPKNVSFEEKMKIIWALERKKQIDLCKCKASLVYTESFRVTRASQRNPVLKQSNKRKCKRWLTGDSTHNTNYNECKEEQSMDPQKTNTIHTA